MDISNDHHNEFLYKDLSDGLPLRIVGPYISVKYPGQNIVCLVIGFSVLTAYIDL